jgi:GWxTD domain-containing protein
MTAKVLRARPPWGARVVWAPAAAALAAWLAVASAWAARPDDTGPLPWRVGGRLGFTVDAAVFADSAGHTLETYLRLPPSTLAGLTRDPSGAGAILVEAQLRSAYGSRRNQVEQEFEIGPADSGNGLGKVVLLRFPTRPGTQRLRVQVVDILSQKRGLVYVGRVAHVMGTVEGEFEVPAARGGRELSDLEFVWQEGEAGAGAPFRRFGESRVPNPERLYGLFGPGLRAAFAMHGGDTAKVWRWRARVVDARDTVVAGQDGEARKVAGVGAQAEAGFDVSPLPSGGYDLEVRAWQDGDREPLVRRARFSVAWRPESWLRNPRETQDLVHFLLRSEDEESFLTLHPGEQERLLEDFWRRRDPTPGTPENEARTRFLERVAIANERFKSPGGLERGMFTDMGRVYVRYGEPSEILHQVIPSGDNTLVQVLEDLRVSEDRPVGQIEQRGPGGDMRPFEVWIYEGEIPPPPDAEPGKDRRRHRNRLVFLFVDEHGLGDYRQRYSSE